MRQLQLTNTVRRLVAEAFAQMGIADTSELRETILIRDGGYCGRRFETDEACAIWFLEEDQLKVYHSDGTLACVLHPVCAADRNARAAA
jgi:hypothetical protein